MSRQILNRGGVNITAPRDMPGYEYDPVNDWFKDLATGKIFSSRSDAISMRLQNKKVTSNGTYAHDAGYDGLGVVTVDVPAPNLQHKTITTQEVTVGRNQKLTGTVTPSGCDGFDEVQVRIDVNDFLEQNKVITENGTYTPDLQGFKVGFDSFTVNVPPTLGYAWESSSGMLHTLNVHTAPDSKDGIKMLSVIEVAGSGSTYLAPGIQSLSELAETYEKLSDTSFKVSYTEDNATVEETFTRSPGNDLKWQ